ncbi:MAG TPA: NlpC/P60 family protein [Candidatus Sulfotelmatobacter sp.]
MVRNLRKTVWIAFLCGMAFGVCWGKENPAAKESATGRHALNSRERRTVVAVALKSTALRRDQRDCSHLVHAVFERAGFPYAYAPSDDLYDGSIGFQRVSKPKPGDLIVWRGHVGIVIQPSEHAFFSFLRSGPAVDDYSSEYWASRGRPRFYRYLKN